MRKLSLLFLLLFPPLTLFAYNTVNGRFDTITVGSITTISPFVSIPTSTYTTGYSSAGFFFGDGSNLTGIISGIDLNNDASTIVVGSTWVNFGYGLDVDGSGTVDVDTDTIQSDFVSARLYSIVIGTYTGVGIDYNAYSVSTFTANLAFQSAIDNATTGNIIFVKAGTYVFSSSVTVNKTLVFVTKKATLYADTLLDKDVDNYSRNIFRISASNIVFSGFSISGEITTGDKSYLGFYVDSSGDGFRIEQCNFGAVSTSGGAGDSGAIFIATGADGCSIANCNFVGQCGRYTLGLQGQSIRLSNLYMDSGYTGLLIANGVGYTIINNIYMVNYTNQGIIFSDGDFHVLNGFVIKDCKSPITFSGYNDHGKWAISNGVISGTTASDGINMVVNYPARNVTITNVVFNDIGTSASNTESGINLLGQVDGMIINNCQFTGTIDNYAINIASNTSQRIQITNCDFNNMSGNVGYIFNNSTSTYSSANYPLTTNFDVLVPSQTAGGYPDIGVPKYLGTRVTTGGSYQDWISTGTSNNTDWSKF